MPNIPGFLGLGIKVYFLMTMTDNWDKTLLVKLTEYPAQSSARLYAQCGMISSTGLLNLRPWDSHDTIGLTKTCFFSCFFSRWGACQSPFSTPVKLVILTHQWQIKDFPWGAWTPEAVMFHKFCMSKWKNLDPWGGMCRACPLDPPMHINQNYKCCIKHKNYYLWWQPLQSLIWATHGNTDTVLDDIQHPTFHRFTR